MNGHSRAGKKFQKVVKLSENAKRCSPLGRTAHFTRRSPGNRDRLHPRFELVLIRARFYQPTTGEFISQDPIGYVDGMSLYRGYFVPGGVDPWGLCQGVDCGPEYEKGVVRLQWTMGDEERVGWEVDMRAKITDCNLETRTRIQKLLTNGYASIRQISLSGLTKENPCVKKFFGELTDKQFESVLKRINKLKGKFEKSWAQLKGHEFAFKCECECSKYPAVRAGLLQAKQTTNGIIIGSREISLCPAFFEQAQDLQTTILLHEGFHLTGSVDWAYWSEGQWVTLDNDPVDIGPNKLINTSDAYEEFVRCWLANRNKE